MIDVSRAWQPYRPDDKNPWDLKKVGHLYRRAAFSANSRQLDEAMANGPEKTIAGMMKKKAVTNACCCVDDTVEISNPTPSMHIKNSTAPANRTDI